MTNTLLCKRKTQQLGLNNNLPMSIQVDVRCPIYHVNWIIPMKSKIRVVWLHYTQQQGSITSY